MSSTRPALPTPNEEWSSEQSPLHAVGFRYYVPTLDPEWTPLIVLGFEVDEVADVGRSAGAPAAEGWYGEAAFSPLIWEPSDASRPFLRVLHQCGGMMCLQRAVIGFPLWPKDRTRYGVEQALSAISGCDSPTLFELARADSILRDATATQQGGRGHGLGIDRTHRRCVESFLVIDLPDDHVLASSRLRPLFDDDLPADLGELFAPRADVLDALKGRAIPRASMCLFALDANED